MAKPSGDGDRFAVLLERVEQHYRLLCERVDGLDQKLERELQAVRRDMDAGFNDLRIGIKSLVNQVQNHDHPEYVKRRNDSGRDLR